MDAIGPYTTQGETGTVTWMALTGDDAADFSFNRSNGHLMFVSTPDFETPGDMNEDNVYEVTLMATAGLDSDELDLIVTVTNMDEDGRVTFWRDGQDVTDEAIMVGDELGGAVDDSDGNPDDGFPIAMYTRIANVTSWQWSKSMTPDMMDSWMDIGTGGMYTVMDTDAGYYLRATATYTDMEGSGKMESAMTAGMVGGDVNNAPEFSAETAERSVADGATAGDNVGAPVEATDADNDTLTYTLSGADMASFAIDDASGQITVATGVTLDAATMATYVVTVTATDPSGAMDMVDVTVTVTTTGDTLLGTYDADNSGLIERSEAVKAVLDYLIRDEISRAQAIEVVTAHILETAVP